MTRTRHVVGSKEITFRRYLEIGVRRSTFGDTPEGDFAKDALGDQFFRNDFKKWDDLELYLLLRHACPEAIQAAKKLFKKWKAAQ